MAERVGLDARLDHVAVAAERLVELWPRYIGELGGTWVGGGETAGFAFGQVAYANGMKVEALEPCQVGENDFLRRFLDRNGPGAHHVTFKVADLSAALSAADALGFGPINVDLEDPQWKEAFLHPKDACGIVVQLAQMDGEADWPPAPDDLPASRLSAPARLDRITHVVADTGRARRLFQQLLGGQPGAEGNDSSARWFDLGWEGGGCIRLVTPNAPGSVETWLGDRPGRFHHLALATTRPDTFAGAHVTHDGRFEVPPEANAGVRLLLTSG